MKRPQHIYGLTLVAWIIAVCADAAWHMVGTFNLMPTDEVYANSFDFQLLAYGLTRLPFWIVGLMLVLILEFCVLGRKSSKDNLKTR